MIARLALAALLVLPGLSRGEDRGRTFHRALDAFEAARRPEEFAEAARLFEAVLEGGYENGAVCYDLGNAWYRAGQYGRAIAAYRQALRHLPRDGYVRANLEAAQAAAAASAAEPAPAWWQRVLFWHAELAQRERLWLSAACWTLVFALALARLVLKTPERPRPALRAGLVAAAAVALVCSASAALGQLDESVPRGVVVAEAAARKGDGETYEPAFDKPLKEGSEFVVLETRGAWIQIRLPGVGDGWVPSRSVVTY
ncbi:MAG: tetratricopeptide repeat protein [Planctomycetota bacterium]|nr:tetratricopeptide repeat protein [Planctomycetota bacterium]